MSRIKLFNGSMLTARFFAIFIGFSFLTIVSIIIITAIIIFTKAPHFKDHRFPLPHEMVDDKDGHHPDGFDRGFDKHSFDRKRYPRPGSPPELFNDLILALSIFAFLAVVLSFLVAHYLSRYFLQPVSELANATKKFSQHDFSTRIPVNRKDEIGMLANDFNDMAQMLEKYESMRKQWVADIAHELRTPISIMQAEVEAVQDSVWPLEMKTMDHLHSEILYLAKTVNDLHLLSMAESRALTLNMEQTSVTDLLTDAAVRFEEKLKNAGVTLEMELPDSSSSVINADPYLLRTVFNNLIENSIRYTDPPGRLKISSFIENGYLVTVFDDTPPGVSSEHIEKIFDRLFRADPSRSRKHGGSGLGLSTCKAHIETMGGTIKASASSLGGLRMTVKMPVSKENGVEK